MEVRGKVCVVTGGASGIGAALCRRFSAEGAAGIAVVDRDHNGAETVGRQSGGESFHCDLANEQDIYAMVEAVNRRFGRIDVLCNNAGIANDEDFLTGSLEPWRQQWAVNVMSHVHAARAVLPEMLARGEGAVLHTASMAGLLTSQNAPAYTATKSAVVALAEWLSITYGRRGIQVYLLAPLRVDTPMIQDRLRNAPERVSEFLRLAGGAGRTPEEVADQVVRSFEREEFLILTDPLARKWMQKKASDLEGWLESCRRTQEKLDAASSRDRQATEGLTASPGGDS